MLEWLQLANPDIIVALIAGLFALLAAFITYYQTKKISVFQSYFERKANSYENFMSEIRDVPRNREQMDIATSAASRARLYCNDETASLIEDLVAIVVELGWEFKESGSVSVDEMNHFIKARNALNNALRSEIKKCKKFKFY